MELHLPRSFGWDSIVATVINGIAELNCSKFGQFADPSFQLNVLLAKISIRKADSHIYILLWIFPRKATSPYEECPMHEWAELRHFRYLLKILEKQGFRVAADELHTSQPNLSVQARQFQENASVRLFRKLKNGSIRPTETGIAFIALARLLLDTCDEVINALIAVERGEIRTLRFGCSPLVDSNLFRKFCAVHREILPGCPIRPTLGDSEQLAEEITNGLVNAALVTLPLAYPDLHFENISRDRLVACLRRDHPLAGKLTLQIADLKDNLRILYHPKRHPSAHERLLELLADAGIKVEDYSHASHPSEMQMLVKEGHGFTLIREGTPLDAELIARPIAGVNWTVDTAVIYHKQQHPKTIPILVRKLRMHLDHAARGKGTAAIPNTSQPTGTVAKRPPQAVKNAPAQLELYK
jgi:DNA-binding transcriptional LysR family regulator